MNKNIFLPRQNILPYEYPQLLAYKDAIDIPIGLIQSLILKKIYKILK